MNKKRSIIVIASILLIPGALLGSALAKAVSVPLSPLPDHSAAAEQDDKVKKEKIEAVNAQLAKLIGDENWKERKKIARIAIENDGIHPDHIEMATGRETPLYEAVLRDGDSDLEFARFLLGKGADANQYGRISKTEPIFIMVKTVAMAQLLFDHKGDGTVKKHGARCLSDALFVSNSEPDVIDWYANHGVDVNQPFEG